jgi:hypothetical protein
MNNTLHSQYVNSFYVDGYDKFLSELWILEDGCRIEFMYLTTWDVEDINNNNSNISCTDIRRMMFHGFELSWLNSLCDDGWFQYLDENNKRVCCPAGLHQTTPPFSKLKFYLGLIVGEFPKYI